MANANPQENFEDKSWLERIEIIRTLSLFPAITVMVFIRRKLGFRLMKPIWLIVMTLILLAIPIFFNGLAAPFGFIMVLYALAMLGLGLFQRWQRWKDLCAGSRWHTYSPGVSFLENLPFPPFLKSHRRINRFVEPPAVALVGLLIGLLLSHGLGLWIMFSAFFLYVYEQNLYDKQLAHDLDTLDGLIAAEVQAETVKHFEGAQPEERQRTLEDTAGIPTGLAPDIHKQVELRRAKQRTPAPDNLAAETPESPA